MISIITAIYNQISMNRLFLEYLNRYTHNKFELIIIDNGSTDGSDDFFEKNGAVVIRNEANYSYPHCMNQGIAKATYDNLVFLNNDLLVSKDWDKKILEIMNLHGLEIATCCATDRVESNEATYRSQKKWKYIRNPLLFLFGPGYYNLKLMHYLNYGNWDVYTKKRYQLFGNKIKEGIAGSNVFMKHSALDKIGLWDIRIQSADFDLFIRAKLRSIEVGDIKPVNLILGIYFHHFIRLTVKSNYPPFKDLANIISIEEKWDEGINKILEESGMKIH